MATDSSSGAGVWIVVASLFSSLACYIVLASYTHTILGATTYAHSAVTVAFWLNTAIGVFLSGRQRKARAYRKAELGLALYCVAFPLLLPWFSEIYLAMAPSITDASLFARNAARFAFTTLVTIAPGFCVGVTIDSLARNSDRRRLVSAMTMGAALGLLVTGYVVVPRFGLVAAIAIATTTKLCLAATGAPSTHAREPAEPLTPIDSGPLPWRNILIAAAVTSLVFGVVFFRTVLAFVIQNPILLPTAGAACLTAALLIRLGFEITPLKALWFATFVSGALVYALEAVSQYRVGLWLAVAAGALIGGWVRTTRRWIGVSLALAGASVLIALVAGFRFPTELAAASVLGAVFSAAARSAERASVALVYAAGAGGVIVSAVSVPYIVVPSLGELGTLRLIGSLLLVLGGVAIATLADIPKRRAAAGLALSAIVWGPLLPLRAEAPELAGDDGEPSAVVAIAALFTPERTSALVEGALSEAIAADEFETVVTTETTTCPPARLGACLPETARSVLFESAQRYDVIAIRGSRPREFYELASKRLRRLGVLVQRLSVRHHSTRHLFAVINTARSEFSHVSLWHDDDSAIVLASNEPLVIDLSSVRSGRDHRTFVSGSPFELLRGLVVVGDDMDDFLDSEARLINEDRAAVITDARPMRASDVPEGFAELHNRAVFERFRSREPFGFRGIPTDEETMLARAAFARGSLPLLARAWYASPKASLAASTWFYDEVGGGDASELRANLGHIANLTANTNATISCEPLPRFVSRVERISLSVMDASGESLDGTEPADMIDGAFDPIVSKGWRARPTGGAITVDVDLETPARVGTVSLVVRPLDDGHKSVTRTRLYGRDMQGTWRPLARDAGSRCDGVRRFRWDASTPVMSGLRLAVYGDRRASGLTLHELWVEGS